MPPVPPPPPPSRSQPSNPAIYTPTPGICQPGQGLPECGCGHWPGLTPQSSHFHGACWAHLAEGGGVKVPKLDGLFWAHPVAGHKPGEEVRGHGQVARVVAARPGGGVGGEGAGEAGPGDLSLRPPLLLAQTSGPGPRRASLSPCSWASCGSFRMKATGPGSRCPAALGSDLRPLDAGQEGL